MITRYLVIGCFLIPAQIPAQVTEPPGRRAPYLLREIASYGSAEYVPARGADELTRLAQGDMFGRIAEVRMGPERDELFVLDNLAMKLVAINEGGTPRVVFRWRQGMGPGEFTQPRSFAFTSDGFVVVDQSDPRLSFFTRKGEFERIQRLAARGIEIIEVPHGFAVNRVVIREGREQVLLLSSIGEKVDSVIPVAGRTAHFTPFGEPGKLYLSRSGKPLLASPVAGMICELERPLQCRGSDLFPAVKGGITNVDGTPVRGVDVGVRGAVELQTGETVILVMITGTPPTFWLLILDASLKYLGHVYVGDVWLREMTGGFTGDDLFISTDEPYPRVVRYELRRNQDMD